MSNEITNVLEKAIKETAEEFKIKVDFENLNIDKLIETPPNPELGDFAFPCFALARDFKMSPNDIALKVREKIPKKPKGISDIQTQGPYVNFFFNRNKIAIDLIQEIRKQGDNFGKSEVGKQEVTLVEFPSPNTNKPLHLGHALNMSIGESVSRISEFNSEKVKRVNLNNDKGVHICKSMLAYQKWGKNKKPTKTKKSDHFVGDFYVMFAKKVKNKPELENEAHEMLRKWEAGDKEVVEIWKKMNTWALNGWKETYKTFDIKHDKEYYESEIYNKGKKIILKGAEKGIFEKLPDGSIKVDLEKEGLGEKYLLRGDGTTLYITQDIYLAELKKQDFNFTKSYYIVGNEQDYHFKVLFNVLGKLGFDLRGLKHISYGMVELPEGKMKSREGTVVDADVLIQSVQSLVKKELSKREKFSKTELEKRSLIIALAAIKFMLLKIDIKRNRVFNPKESIAFEGDTGPYLLYSYARASSILRKAKSKKKIIELSNLEDKESQLVLKMNKFKDVVLKSYFDSNPSLVANYALDLAHIFNEFYHECPVIGSKEKEAFRLALVESFRQVLKNTLWLLGINVLEKM